jgi:putative IMPACT (imprinted ancient) family translation regulator
LFLTLLQWAYRLTETVVDSLLPGTNLSILKHDNDDDGEDAAGGRLAQLLQMRNENGILIVVSRWFGGILLGSKRFGIITNVAREGLVKHHERQK